MTQAEFQLPTQFVDTPDQLQSSVEQWKKAEVLAVDLECSLTGMHHSLLALIQVATHDAVWLVDSMVLHSEIPSALKVIQSIPWICHDFSNDGVVLKRLYNFVPESVFDTMLLAKALGYPQPGLKAMAKIKLGVEVNKDEQDSNWVLRPLRDSQLAYAAQDAALLLPLLRRLANEVEERKEDLEIQTRVRRLPDEMESLFRRLHAYQKPENDPIIEKAEYFGEDSKTIAKTLCHLRVTWGNEGDIGAIMEMGNRWILRVAEHPPKTMDALKKTIRNPRFFRDRGELLWNVIEPFAQKRKTDYDDDLLWENG